MDGNKTALTHRATATAAAYLDRLGCKPVETEVQIAPHWIADVATFWYPTLTELKKLQLEAKAAKLLLDTGADATARVFGYFGGGPFTVLAEVKMARGDFLQDKKWTMPHPAHICVLVYTLDVLKEKDEIPTGWYGLRLNADGTRVNRLERPKHQIHPQHPGPVLDFIAQVAIRRDHRSRYRAFKDWAKAYRAEDRERKHYDTVAHLLSDLVSWLQNEGRWADRPIEALLADQGIKKVPRYLQERIAFLEKLRD